MPPSQVVIIKYPNIFKEEFENVTESCQGIQGLGLLNAKITNQNAIV